MTQPLVGIPMGSDSDLPVMEKAADVLKEMGGYFEMDIISVHCRPCPAQVRHPELAEKLEMFRKITRHVLLGKSRELIARTAR